jgi:hypothetical protein
MHHVLRNRLLIGLILIGSTCVGLLDLRQPEMASRSLVFKVIFLLFFDVVFATVVWAMGTAVLALTILTRKYHGVLCEHTIEVTDRGLIERTDVNETVHRWAGFHKVVRSRRYLRLYVTDALVHTVPLRAFASEQQIEDFLREIQRYTETG